MRTCRVASSTTSGTRTVFTMPAAWSKVTPAISSRSEGGRGPAPNTVISCPRTRRASRKGALDGCASSMTAPFLRKRTLRARGKRRREGNGEGGHALAVPPPCWPHGAVGRQGLGERLGVVPTSPASHRHCIIIPQRLHIDEWLTKARNG